MKDVSAHSQRVRMLTHLKANRELTTHDARTELDVMSPAARVHELRTKGYNIVTHWDMVDTGYGTKHRVAKYVLLSGTYRWPEAA